MTAGRRCRSAARGAPPDRRHLGKLRAGGLHVRVPDLPEATNRVFQVKVFHLGQEAPEICDAGTIRIGAVTPRKVG